MIEPLLMIETRIIAINSIETFYNSVVTSVLNNNWIQTSSYLDSTTLYLPT